MGLDYKKNFKVGMYEVDFEVDGKLIELSGEMHYIKEENGRIRNKLKSFENKLKFKE